MTTSHRPQLEARNGAKNIEYVPTSTQHARLLPGHKEVKYRSTKKRVSDHKLESTRSDDAHKRAKSSSEDGGLENEQLQTTDSSDEYEEEEDESEDDEALLEEWNKLKQDRLNKKLKEQQAETTQKQSKEVPSSQKNGSWRSKTVFGRRSAANRTNAKQTDQTHNNKEKYVNDITRSEYHKDFIRKHIK
ncbi:unnamed protein product [Kluyveromyces dobzhanskii CBS 2104]|uniref:Pre-mRNA-splicing factor CWC15 n=1 Tax=Kluyveromyces dobzhanskii CBS 2104 TaxID=1427455 RepID=A0A0A8L4K7_9SACH|nr:unnamed protein product [Kluyveromyces dobzhanskii CBS 2104]